MSCYRIRSDQSGCQRTVVETYTPPLPEKIPDGLAEADELEDVVEALLDAETDMMIVLRGESRSGDDKSVDVYVGSLVCRSCKVWMTSIPA